MKKRARYVLGISASILCILIIGFVSTVSAKTPTLHAIPLPHGVKKIDRTLFYPPSKKLFVLGINQDDTYGVWAYGGRIFEKKLILNDAYINAHFFLDSKNNIYLNSNRPHRLYRSSDGGEHWDILSEDAYMFWGLADDTHGTLYATTWYEHAKLYKSTDLGNNWTLVTDFHTIFPEETIRYSTSSEKMSLRHLHDIIVDGSTITLGTGDVTRWTLRSTDGGTTWKQIWDEGFTGHYTDWKKGFAILGADGKKNDGLAYYDMKKGTVQNTWRPNDHRPWTNYMYSIIKHRNKYYAGIHIENNINHEKRSHDVLVSSDGKKWKPFIEFQSTDEFNELNLASDGENRIYMNHGGQLYWMEVK